MDMLTNFALLRLLQLASSTLPVGAYSYSEGLETLAQQDRLPTAACLQDWVQQELTYGVIRVEAAVMLRSHRATLTQDLATLTHWNRWLTATRETAELRSQSLQMGRSLLRLWQDLADNATAAGPIDLPPSFSDEGCNFAIAFGIVAAAWQIEEQAALLGYLHSWATNLVSAGLKLIPLGQTAGQQLLLELGGAIGPAATTILTLEDDDLASCSWGLSLASMAHETLYSRLFRS
jgi:urease accessory protein